MRFMLTVLLTGYFEQDLSLHYFNENHWDMVGLNNEVVILKMQLGLDHSNLKKLVLAHFPLFMVQFSDHIFHCSF